MVRTKNKFKHKHDGNDDYFEITDYTQASSWENLIAKLEDVITSCCETRKSSFDHSFQFNNTNFQLVYISPINTSSLNKNEISKISKLKYNGFMNAKNDFQYKFINNDNINLNNSNTGGSGNNNNNNTYQVENFLNWFGIQEYFLMLALRDNGPNVSDLSTLVSAFSIALHNCNCYLPAFVGFDEKRYENFIGYMYAPITNTNKNSSSSIYDEDHFFVKFATESIILSTLTSNQNISESFEKQLRIFYSKISVDPDDRNWEQFLALSTTSTKYTYIKGNLDDTEWRYSSNNNNNKQQLQQSNQHQLQQQQQQQQSYDEDEYNDDENSKIKNYKSGDEIFRWGYPMDPINELHYCVMCPPIKSTHILENDFQSIQTPKSWFIKVVFRKPHNSLFQLSIGVINIFTSYVEAIKSIPTTTSIKQILSDYNLYKTSSSSSSSSLNTSPSYQQQHHKQTTTTTTTTNQSPLQQSQQQQSQQQSPQIDDSAGILKTMGSFTKSLASSLSSPLIPTSKELDMLLHDLFFETKDPSDIYHFNNIPEEELNQSPLPPKNTRIKRSPIDSLFFSFSLMCLNIQSLVGILLFWNEFVEELKWHWEHQILIPRTFSSSHISVNNCLIFQKLQMINYCIKRKQEYEHAQQQSNNQDNDSSAASAAAVHSNTKNSGGDGWDNDDDIIIPTTNSNNGGEAKEQDGWDDFEDTLDGLDDDNNNNNNSTTKQQQQQQEILEDENIVELRYSSGGNIKKLKDQFLLYHDREIVIPETQEVGPMTDDMVQDHLNEMSDDSITQEKRIEMQTVSLLSDMQSFKYFNPGCVFEDFIRWHSNTDWITHPTEIKSIEKRLSQISQEKNSSKNKKQQQQQDEDEDEDDLIKPINSDGDDDDDDQDDQDDQQDDDELIQAIDEFDESNGREKKNGFGRNGCLSLRMSGNDTIWRKTWIKSKPLPISKQIPLFDHNKQASNAIHYLESILPSDLIHQIMSVILTSITTIFSNEKTKSNLSSEYCLGIDFPPLKQLVEKYFDTVNSIWPSQTPQYESLKTKDFDPIFKSLQDIENSYSKLISLKTKFSKLDRVINNLYKDGYSDILDKEFESVSYLFFGDIEDYEYEMENGDGIPQSIQPNIKEYITRSYSPRPYKSSQMMPHKMYTCISPYECRISTSISEEDL